MNEGENVLNVTRSERPQLLVQKLIFENKIF